MELLTNRIQPYAWGSTTSIPAILGEDPTGAPQAELWVGAHPVAPSRVVRRGAAIGLDEVVTADPVGELGTDAAARFGRFPFLLKILAAAAPLSLQAHPSPEQARAGFAAEEAAGIPRDAPERNYRDDWPKPEIACALTPFRALAGFRPVEESLPVLAALAAHAGEPLLTSLAADLAAALGAGAPGDGLAHALRSVLEIPEPQRAPVAAAVARAAAAVLAEPSTAGQVRADLRFAVELLEDYPHDPSVLVALLLNRITLAPGEAVYLPAGNLHAYLEGTAVELMASSDNVLRGGLTAKHVDVAELLAVLDTTPRPPHLVAGHRVSAHQQEYPTPTPQFRLSRIEVPDATPFDLVDTYAADSGPQLVLCVAGSASVAGGGATVVLSGGRAAYVRSGEGPVTVTGAPSATLFRARIGDGSAAPV